MNVNFIYKIYDNNVSKLFLLLLLNIYAFNNYDNLSKFNNLIGLINETLPISIILLISYFADYIKSGFKNINLLLKLQNKYLEYENFFNFFFVTSFFYFNSYIFQLLYFWCINLSALVNYFVNYLFNLPILPYSINDIQEQLINDDFKINYYNNMLITFGLVYLVCLYHMRYFKGQHYELLGLIYLVIHYFLAPSIFKLILNRKFDLIIYLNFKIIVTVFLNQLINYSISIIYPSWINDNLIPFGGFHLWSLYTFLAYFVLEIYDIKIFFGYIIIAFQYIQNTGNPAKQFKSIPNQLICIFIDCINNFFNEYKKRENQKKINNQVYKKVKYLKKNKKYNEISYYKIQLYDKLYIPNNTSVPQDCIVIENIDNNNHLISVNTVKIDGEINDKFKKIVKYKNIKKNKDFIKLIKSIKNNKIYYVKKGSIVKSNVIVVITNIPNNKNYLSKINNNKFYNYLKIIEKFFILETLLLTMFHSWIYYIIYGNIELSIIINILMSIQMINPMILNTILLFVNNLYKNINLSINSKFKLISIFDNNLITNVSSRLIHFTDKTGTLTKNKLNFIGISKFNSKWEYNDIKTIKNNDELIKTLVSCTLNDKVNNNIVPEEKAIFESLDIKWLSTKNLEKYTVKQVEINNKYYVIETINLGIDKILRGSYTLIIERKNNKNYYKIAILCSNNLFNKLSKKPIINNFEKNEIEKEDLIEINNLINVDGAPRFWNLLVSNEFDDTYINNACLSYDNLRNISLDSLNDNFMLNIEKYHHPIINFINDLNFDYYGCLLIKDIYMDNADKLVNFNLDYLGSYTCMITGDNFANASIIAENLNFNRDNNILFCNIDEIKNYILNNDNNWFINKNIIFYNCEPEDKEFIIKYFKDYKYNIIYSGDGLNDIYAMRESDFVIGFPDSSQIVNNKYQINPYVEMHSDMNINNLNWNNYLNENFFTNTHKLININHNTINNILIKQSLLAGLYSGFIISSKYLTFSDPFNTFIYQIYMLVSVITNFKYLIVKNKIRKNINYLFEYIKYYLLGNFFYFFSNYVGLDINITLIFCLIFQIYF